MSKNVKKYTKKTKKTIEDENVIDFQHPNRKSKIYKDYPEYRQILELVEFEHPLVRKEILSEIKYKGKVYPIYAFHIGSEDPTTPVVYVNGGVHGLEKIGTHVIITYLQSLFKQLTWNKTLEKHFKKIRLITIPVINPVGMANNMRSNGNGVDLMRNAPIQSQEAFNFPLISGHSISPRLPWYRGDYNGKLEQESQILMDFVRKYCFEASVSIAIDLHSGFGIRDRLWYPYATSRKKYPLFKETRKLLDIFEETYPHHVYIIEQQSDSYTVHGDLWDELFHEQYKNFPDKKKIFIPLCLEMGSWTWLKKNPKQIFNIDGIYNPIVEHRRNRVMRRHLYLFEFLLTAVENKNAWIK